MPHKPKRALDKNRFAEAIRRQHVFEDAAIALDPEKLDDVSRKSFEAIEYCSNPDRLRFSDNCRRALLDVLGAQLTPQQMFTLQVVAHTLNDVAGYTRTPRQERELPSRVLRLCKAFRTVLLDVRKDRLALQYLIMDSKVDGVKLQTPPDVTPRTLLLNATAAVDSLINRIDRMRLAAEMAAEPQGRTGRPKESARDRLIVLLAHWYQTATGRRAGWSERARFPRVVRAVLSETRLYVPKNLLPMIRDALKSPRSG
jgi:hypothetical protein